jgi:hypothetical protein
LTDENGEWRPDDMTLDPGHYKLFWQDPPGAIDKREEKHKVFWVEPCEQGGGGASTPTPTPRAGGGGSMPTPTPPSGGVGGVGGTATPPGGGVGGVGEVLPPGGGAGGVSKPRRADPT